MKIIGIILAFTGGMTAFIASLGYFFEDRFMHHFTYNQINAQARESITITGTMIFLIAILAITLALFASKYHYPKLFFIMFIILGAVLLTLLSLVQDISTVVPFIAGLLILSGGVIGDIAVTLEKKIS